MGGALLRRRRWFIHRDRESAPAAAATLTAERYPAALHPKVGGTLWAVHRHPLCGPGPSLPRGTSAGAVRLSRGTGAGKPPPGRQADQSRTAAGVFRATRQAPLHPDAAVPQATPERLASQGLISGCTKGPQIPTGVHPKIALEIWGPGFEAAHRGWLLTRSVVLCAHLAGNGSALTCRGPTAHCAQPVALARRGTWPRRLWW